MVNDFLLENDQLVDGFRKHYTALFFKVLDSSENKTIDLSQGSVSAVCKYCGEGVEGTTFKRTSHAIPMVLGNRTLLDSLECDVCNKHFADYLEDGFSKFTMPHRIVNTIRGRKNPKYKDDRFEITFAGRGNIQVNILTEGESKIEFEAVDAGHQLKYTFIRQSYRPVSVYKTFVKIALALMPVIESSRLGMLKRWILDKDYEIMFSGIPVVQWEFQGAFDPNKIKCGFFKVKDEYEKLYFKFVLVLAFGNLQYNVVIPDPMSEQDVSKKMLNFPALIDNFSVETCGAPAFEYLYFDSGEIVKGEKVEISMLFETREKIDP